MYTAFENFEDQLDEVYNERTRTKEFNGRSYTIRCHDPYGFWKVEGKAKLPDVLKQNFTTIEQAWAAVGNYELNNRTRLDQAEDKKNRHKPKEIEI